MTTKNAQKKRQMTVYVVLINRQYKGLYRSYGEALDRINDYMRNVADTVFSLNVEIKSESVAV